MITHAQYLEYKRLVEEYEQAECEDGMRDAEDEVNHFDEDDDDFDEYDTRLNCKCGAWILGKKGLVHVADCVCGAD
jgi:hypothetical protein